MSFPFAHHCPSTYIRPWCLVLAISTLALFLSAGPLYATEATGTPQGVNATVNLIRNGDFSQGVDPWLGGLTNGTGNELQVRNGELCLLGIPSGIGPADAQIAQYDLPLALGQRYQIDFDMLANAPATAKLMLVTSREPWVHYFVTSFSVSSQRQHFSFTFTMQQPPDLTALFAFHLGGQTASEFCLDNVVVQNLSSEPAPISVRQSALEMVSANTIADDGGNIWGGHQTRIVRTAAGVFTTYSAPGNNYDYMNKEWWLAWRKGDGTWPVIAGAIGGREPVNLLAGPDGTLYIVGWPNGIATLWSGKPANGTIQMTARPIPGMNENNWPYNAAGIDQSGNLCALDSNATYANQQLSGGYFQYACYLPAQARWVTKYLTFDYPFKYVYVMPQPSAALVNGGLSLVGTRDLSWEEMGYTKPADPDHPACCVFNAFRYWQTSDLVNRLPQPHNYAEEPQTPAYLNVRLNAQMDAYRDTQGRMHILYSLRGERTGRQKRFFHRVVAPDGTTLQDGEIQRNGERAMGDKTRVFEDKRGRLYLISGSTGQLFPLGSDGFTLGPPVQLNLGGYTLAYTGVWLAVPRTGAPIGNVMDVVFGTIDETKWLYFQLDLLDTTSPPTAPSALTATTVSNRQIDLSWTDDSNNESGFQIERCTGSGCNNFAQIFSSSANLRSYASTGLLADTTYCYRVRAFNSAGNSSYSNTVCRTTGPIPPTNLSASRLLASEVNLAWVETAGNESGYKLQRCTGITCTNFAQVALLPSNGIGYHQTGLAANTVYRFRVVGYNDNGNSSYSNILSITTLAVAAAVQGVEDAAEEAIAVDTPLFLRRPQEQLALEHGVTCFNQTQPGNVALWIGEQVIEMTQSAGAEKLYLAIVTIEESLGPNRDYPLYVRWECAGTEAPLEDYLGLLQVVDSGGETVASNRAYLPLITR